MAKAQANQIPQGYYEHDTKVAKKTEPGIVTTGEEYTIVDYFNGMYGFIGDDGEVSYVDMYGGYFK